MLQKLDALHESSDKECLKKLAILGVSYFEDWWAISITGFGQVNIDKDGFVVSGVTMDGTHMSNFDIHGSFDYLTCYERGELTGMIASDLWRKYIMSNADLEVVEEMNRRNNQDILFLDAINKEIENNPDSTMPRIYDKKQISKLLNSRIIDASNLEEKIKQINLSSKERKEDITLNDLCV